MGHDSEVAVVGVDASPTKIDVVKYDAALAGWGAEVEEATTGVQRVGLMMPLAAAAGVVAAGVGVGVVVVAAAGRGEHEGHGGMAVWGVMYFDVEVIVDGTPGGVGERARDDLAAGFVHSAAASNHYNWDGWKQGHYDSAAPVVTAQLNGENDSD